MLNGVNPFAKGIMDVAEFIGSIHNATDDISKASEDVVLEGQNLPEAAGMLTHLMEESTLGD